VRARARVCMRARARARACVCVCVCVCAREKCDSAAEGSDRARLRAMSTSFLEKNTKSNTRFASSPD